MDFKERFIHLSQFLKKTQYLHEIEFLKRYPEPYPDYLASWIHELSHWSLNELAQFESYPHEDQVSDPDFKEYLEQVRTLTRLKQLTLEESPLRTDFTRQMNPKKRHEIQILKTLLDRDEACETIIDVGGGMGHLTCALISDSKTKSICIDPDRDIQAAGIRRVEKWMPEAAKRIRFIGQSFSENTEVEGFTPNSTSIIGLHSCGRLSNSVIRFGIKHRVSSLINFACCYHKLDGDYNLSSVAESQGLTLSPYALHLATRSSAVVTDKELNIRLRVRNYRYALHYFLSDHFNKSFLSLGNTREKDYDGDFATYARKYYRVPELAQISDQTLNDYYRGDKTQQKVKCNILADLIRLQLGRVIETYLVLDRALYLIENGRDVEVCEVFDRRLSPRNIMLKSVIGESPQLNE